MIDTMFCERELTQFTRRNYESSLSPAVHHELGLPDGPPVLRSRR